MRVTKTVQAREHIERCGVIAMLRMASSARLVECAQAIVAGGVAALEVALTTPNALQAIREIADCLAGQCLVGAGSVLDGETARLAILSGAELIVSPVIREDVIRTCRRYGAIAIPGALTPTEVLQAYEAGADLVKVFPATVMGPGYIKSLKGPLPQVALAAAGGITVDKVDDFIRAGGSAVIVGRGLADEQILAAGQLEVITRMAQRFVAAVQAARDGTD